MLINLDHIKYQFDKGRANVPSYSRGKCCFVLDNDEVKERLGRDNVVLKIFFNNTDTWGDPNWRGLSLERNREIGRVSYLEEATKIQNLAWMGGFAPRVYGLIEVEKNGKRFPAQVVGFVEGKEGGVDIPKELAKLEKYLNQFGVNICHKELLGQHDFIDGKLIDFQGFTFKKNYKDLIIKFIKEKGRYGKGHYQSVPELGISSHPRDTLKRIEYMKFKDINWEGKSVLDVGCNSGMFCNYVSRRGAKRVLGVDQNVLAAKVLANYLGNYNIDYQEIDIKKDGIKEKFDVVLFLSMNVHVGFPDWLPRITRQLMVFEENAKGSRFKPDWWKGELKKYFKSVELIGYGKDHGNKPIFWCKK